MGKIKNEFIKVEDDTYSMLGFFGTDIIMNNNQYGTIDEFDQKLTEDMNILGIARVKFIYEMSTDLISIQPMNSVGSIFNISKGRDHWSFR